MVPGSATKDTSRSTQAPGVPSKSGVALSSRDAIDTSEAEGYRNHTPSASTRPRTGVEAGTASGRSATAGGVSRTSKTRSKLTSGAEHV